MRVVSGSAGGLELRVPNDLRLRPTQDRVRGAIYSMLADLVPEARVLDLFAGVGSLGIEALSRGAAHAVFVENRQPHCEAIRANLAHTRLSPKATVVCSDAMTFLRSCHDTFDLILADPPYDKGSRPASERNDETFSKRKQPAPASPCDFAALAPLLLPRLAPGGRCVFEFFASRPPPDYRPLTALTQRRYGDTGIVLLAAPENQDNAG
jgi:16S rRNA (guanine966-N2)-methyltransferase